MFWVAWVRPAGEGMCGGDLSSGRLKWTAPTDGIERSVGAVGRNTGLSLVQRGTPPIRPPRVESLGQEQIANRLRNALRRHTLAFDRHDTPLDGRRLRSNRFSDCDGGHPHLSRYSNVHHWVHASHFGILRTSSHGVGHNHEDPPRSGLGSKNRHETLHSRRFGDDYDGPSLSVPRRFVPDRNGVVASTGGGLDLHSSEHIARNQ